MSRRRRTKACRCEAYEFPHRLGSGKCREERLEFEALYRGEYDEEAGYLMRMEARACNRESRDSRQR